MLVGINVRKRKNEARNDLQEICEVVLRHNLFLKASKKTFLNFFLFHSNFSLLKIQKLTGLI